MAGNKKNKGKAEYNKKTGIENGRKKYGNALNPLMFTL
jgi:hypothetical protein